MLGRSAGRHDTQLRVICHEVSYVGDAELDVIAAPDRSGCAGGRVLQEQRSGYAARWGGSMASAGGMSLPASATPSRHAVVDRRPRSCRAAPGRWVNARRSSSPRPVRRRRQLAISASSPWLDQISWRSAGRGHCSLRRPRRSIDADEAGAAARLRATLSLVVCTPLAIPFGHRESATGAVVAAEGCRGRRESGSQQDHTGGGYRVARKGAAARRARVSSRRGGDAGERRPGCEQQNRARRRQGGLAGR